MYDGMATEVETLEFLGSLVRLLKPETVIETGTYLGYGTVHLARALRDNGYGRIHTAEPNRDYFNLASLLLIEAQLSRWVIPHHTTGEQMLRNFSPFNNSLIDFAFLDSNLDTRIGEMHALYGNLSPKAIVAVHDTGSQHDQDGRGPRSAFAWFAATYHMQIINFDTPRGLILLRKGTK